MPKKKKEQITKKHYELFKKYCLEHINKLGLLGWKVYFEFKYIEDLYASTSVNLEGRIALITLSTHWDFGRELNQESLNETAKHEVHHLLLFRFSKLARYRFIRSDELEEAEEEIIRILDKFL